MKYIKTFESVNEGMMDKLEKFIYKANALVFPKMTAGKFHLLFMKHKLDIRKPEVKAYVEETLPTQKVKDEFYALMKGHANESVNEAKDNLYLQMHKKYAEQIKMLKAKKIRKLTDLASVQRWAMEDRDDYFNMDPKKKKELSAEYNEERKLFKRYMARDYSVMLPKGTEALPESVNEAEKYNTDKFKIGDKIKTNIGVWEVIETDYKPGKKFMAPFIFKGKDMKKVDIPNPPPTNKDAVGYKVTDGGRYPIIGFLYQYKDITKLATIGVDESVNEGVYDDNARNIVMDIDNANILGKAEMELMQGGLPQARNGEVGSWPSVLIWRKGYDKELYIIPKGKPGQYELYDDQGYERGKEKVSGDSKKILTTLKKAIKVFQ